MANPLYKKLADDFERHDGSLSPYVNSSLVTTSGLTTKHYDIRAFHTSDVTVPWTLLDYTWWQGYAYSTFGLGQVGTKRSLVSQVQRQRLQSDLDTTYVQGALDPLTQEGMEGVVVSGGNEGWPVGDGTVVIGKDSNYRYSNTIRVTLTGGVLKQISSTYADDLKTDFDNTYQIEFVLRAFPSQADAAHLDLANSSIDFSSDVNFAAGVTDTLIFSSSTNNINGTGGTFDTVARWPVTSLTKADLANIKAIRLNLKSVGNMTFIGQALRLVPNGWNSSISGVDTKRKALMRQVPKAGGAESSSVLGDMFFQETRPRNITTWTYLNSGHAPTTGSDDNILRQYYRYNPTTGDRIEVRLAVRSTQGRLFIDQKVGGVTTNLASTSINTNILVDEQDYYLVVTVNGTSVTATVYNGNGVTLGTQLGTLTVTTTTTITPRNYLGMSFEPYNYDFKVYTWGTASVDFGQFVSSNFLSRSPVLGATLYPRTSTPLNMLTGGAWTGFGDGIMSASSDGNTYTVNRTGATVQGGIRYSPAVYIGDSSQIIISGNIFIDTQVRGTYRLGLIDQNDSVAWIYNLANLLPNQWNDFSLTLPGGLDPTPYFLHIQQFGSYTDTFRLRDLAISHNTIKWEATADGGTHWQPFLTALDDRWSAVKFATTGTSLAVRATAESDKAYIYGYNLVPRYLA